MLDKILIHTGRTLLALYFLVPGVFKFLAWDTHIAMMDKHNMMFIPILLGTAGCVQIIASLCLIINRYVAWAALALAALTLIINYNLHDFWNFEGMERAHETQNLVKNMGIFSGLLILAGINFKPKT
ncbi:MAG: DoxX family membrane protein [Cellvibrionaceae bacterium]